jgi:DNA-binding beta-propeller fold protein YncE
MKKSLILAASATTFWACALTMSAAWAASYTTGDVFADVGGGIIKEFTPAGVLVQSLNDTHPGEGDGMAFDASGNLYATAGFAANTVVKFDNSGNLITANFGSGYNSHPESIVVDNTNGVLYVGQADGNANVLKFSLTGTPLGSFAPARQDRGTDWVDLQSDLHTLRYTSEGTSVLSFNLATSAQNANFANGLLGPHAYAHRILSDGGELVADTDRVVRLDSAGNLTHTYTISGTSLLFALNLDPNGTDFWTADYFSGNVFEVNIASGVIDEHWNAGLVSGGPLGGLAVFGEICQTCNPVPAPKPSALAALGFGLIYLGFSAWRRLPGAGHPA